LAIDIIDHITTVNNNDETKRYKPIVATLVFDNDINGNSIQYNSAYDDEIICPTISILDTSANNTSTYQDQPSINTILENTIFGISSKNGTTTLTPHKHNNSNPLQFQPIVSQVIQNNDWYRVCIQHTQNDGGTNRSVTSVKSLLVHYEDIADYGINGVKEGKTAITCTGRGFIPWRANSGKIILI
jgi:predicted restriction endonuclease